MGPGYVACPRTHHRSPMKTAPSVEHSYRGYRGLLLQYTLGTLTLRPCHVDADVIVTAPSQGEFMGDEQAIQGLMSVISVSNRSPV